MYMLEKELLNLKGSKLDQILRADKTGFHRLGHKLTNTYTVAIDNWFRIVMIYIFQVILWHCDTTRQWDRLDNDTA